MSQTSYSTYPAVAYEGQLLPSVPYTVESRVATASIPFGRAVQRVTSDDQVGLTAASGVPQGVAIIEHDKPNDQAEDVLTGQTLSVLKRGRVWVRAVGAVTQGAPAYAIVAVGATQGQFTATVGTNLLVGKFVTGGTDTLVLLDVHL
ncbi:hypothetical protein UFOVP380_32 [uncultured Caudovirales phage]|uniref:Uncharacterized protein n=1 Tax=uncultured Caudovirales phage TaxID=2100421 RepID=A0A6J7X2T8_9CAUD|nr:hypothetical protein UFOVP380_32 [uncultured Caudovirales phage]